MAAGPALAQAPLTLEALAARLERLERQNADLVEEVRRLRNEAGTVRAPAEPARLQALEEKLDLQAGRVAEQDQVKVESSQRVPVRLTGMVLFNAFRNSRHGLGADNPITASIAPGRANTGGTLRQSVVGLEFQGPEAVLGGKLRGSFLLDLFSGAGEALNQQVRLRTASIEAQWGSRGFLVGQEKPIFSPREPNSLAQVGVSPLTGAGNLWRWRPQARFEQRLDLGGAAQLRARIGVSQTEERGQALDPAIDATLEPRRPALEGHFQLTHRFDDQRRIEFAPGFHISTTHVAGFNLPASAFSLDWFVNPHPRLEFTGMWFTGKNLAKLGAGGVRQGFSVFRPGTSQLLIIPVRTRGGWAQLTWVATSRLSFNLYGGQDDPNNRDLPAGGIGRNQAYAANVFYRLAPNVVVGWEVSQVRTRYLSGPRPLYNHYDLAVGYLF